jgi:hypothetical protein
LMFQNGNLLANAPLTQLRASAGNNQTLEDIFRSLASNSSNSREA